MMNLRKKQSIFVVLDEISNLWNELAAVAEKLSMLAIKIENQLEEDGYIFNSRTGKWNLRKNGN